MKQPGLFVLGVRRSGTTLLRVMLDRHSELAVPDESYFIPQLADRHRSPVSPERFLADLRRLPTLREWELPLEVVRGQLEPGMSVGAAVAAVFEAYAESRGKARWGDKTPMYMQHVPLLERLFPDARYVHLVRDGRDAALSFLSMPSGIVTETWAHPRTPAAFAAQWRTEVRAARSLGARLGVERYLELRYEELVSDPAEALVGICGFAGLEYQPAMLDYTGNVDVSRKPHQQRLLQAPTTGVRDWRQDMPTEDVRDFEVVAADLLAELGYEVTSSPDRPRSLRGRAAVASYAIRAAAWRAASRALRRTPLWTRRHPPLD